MIIKSYSKIVLLSTLLIPLLYADATKKTKPVFKTVWQRTYGGDKSDIARGVVMLENGDTAIIGECKSYNAKGSDICVTRINSKGQTIWRKLIRGKRDDRGVAISRAKDGNLLILGSGKSFNDNYNRDLYTAKLSLDGKIIWQRSFGGIRDEFAGGIVGTDDGGALIVGDSESFSKRGYKDIYIVRLDSRGKIVSEKYIGGKRDEEAKAITRTTDGNFVMVGLREIERAGDADFFLMKLDQNGNKIWAKTVGEEAHDVLNGVAPTPDGGIVVTGSTRSFGSEQTDMSVIYFNRDGKLIWHKIYGFKYYDEGNAITVTKNGRFMVAGVTNSMGKGDYDNYIVALDSRGSLIWSKLYGGRKRDIAHGITRTTDDAIVIVGESNSYKRESDFYIIKVK
jgi:uncharacterized delta-60 repeat protein